MIEIETLQQHHKNTWLPLWLSYQEFYESNIPVEVTELNWQRLLNPSEPMLGFAACIDGQLVGIAHAVLHRSFWTAGDYCYLQDLFVDPGVRGHGVGKALIQAVADAATAQGASRVIWLTHETNAVARALYDQIAHRTGFIQYRLKPKP